MEGENNNNNNNTSTWTQPTFTGAEQEETDLHNDESTYKKSNKREHRSKTGTHAGSKRRNKFLFEGVRQELMDLQRENQYLKILIWERIKPLQLAEMVLKDAEAPPIDIYLQSSVLMDEADACIEQSQSRVKKEKKKAKAIKSPNRRILSSNKGEGKDTSGNANGNGNGNGNDNGNGNGNGNAKDGNNKVENKEKGRRTLVRKSGKKPMTRRHSTIVDSRDKEEVVDLGGDESDGGDSRRIPRVISITNLHDSEDCKPKQKQVIFHEEVDSLAAALSGNFAF